MTKAQLVAALHDADEAYIDMVEERDMYAAAWREVGQRGRRKKETNRG